MLCGSARPEYNLPYPNALGTPPFVCSRRGLRRFSVRYRAHECGEEDSESIWWKGGRRAGEPLVDHYQRTRQISFWFFVTPGEQGDNGSLW